MSVQSPSMDPKFREAARHIQEGSWNAAIASLQELLTEYPNQQEDILPLLEHVQLKIDLDKKPVRARSQLSLYFTGKRIARITIAILVMFLIGAGWYTYKTWLVPARLQQQQKILVLNLISDAKDALSQAQYADAARLFEEALAINPDNAEAVEGLQSAQKQLALADKYEQAVQYQVENKTAEALALLEELQATAPNYRDVTQRINAIKQADVLNSLFLQAEEAYDSGAYSTAIPSYQKIREISTSFQTKTIEQHLYDSYVRLAKAASSSADIPVSEIGNVVYLFQQALSLRPQDEESRATKHLLERYLDAMALVDQDRLPEAIQELSSIVETDPTVLGGKPIQSLYDAFIAYGDELSKTGKLWAALAQFSAAADLPIADVSVAKRRMAEIAILLTPTPTPTATPTPTPTPDPIEELRKLVPPTPSPIDMFQGWIAFYSDRPGSPSGKWVMRPDGSEQIPVSDPNNLYEHLQEQAKWSSDNSRRIWVEDDGSGKSVAIYMWRYDVPAFWREARVELLNNSAINYQPVFSPDDRFIAFTSQRSTGSGDQNYGDEIFILSFDEFNPSGYVVPHRLTHNDWEWDKHPTFSPDGRIIAFWSNRETGRAQIWAMNPDGTNQRNLSNNEWNDWDPVFIVPRRDIPKVEKNGDAKVPLFDPAKYSSGN